ncbi:MAG: hypothetical protein M1483_00960 [Actinobacteria bacterium]|nr:hypothetical protein [Actinomycetota bacterium]MCL6104205.1 hypothetical protein [Actinomycetota bacterium]
MESNQQSTGLPDAHPFINNAAVKAFCGVSLILWLLFSETIPLVKTFGAIPKVATVHLLILLLPQSWHGFSTMFLAIPAGIFLCIAFLPAISVPINKLAFLLFLIGMLFFPAAGLIPDSFRIGPLWSLLFFAWLGPMLWFKDSDYFYGSVIAAFFWDMGAGAQGLFYSLHALPEPYGNGIPPIVVTIVDCVGITATIICWIKGVDPQLILEQLLDKVRKGKSGDKTLITSGKTQ